MADILVISKSKISNIENGHTKSIDFFLMDRIAKCFEKDFDYFIDTINQINNIKKLDGSNNNGSTNLFPEIISTEIKKLLDDSKNKDELINALRIEYNMLRNQHTKKANYYVIRLK